MKSDQLLKLAVEATENKKAEDIISLNMQGISDMTDYFVQSKMQLMKRKLELNEWKALMMRDGFLLIWQM